jgi:hypothetical protein
VPTAGEALFAAMSEGSKVRGSLAQYEPKKKELRMQIDFPYAIQWYIQNGMQLLDPWKD